MDYKIYASLKEDINAGWVWILTPNVTLRQVICIKNKNNNKKVFCEALCIDNNFKRVYEKGDTIRIDNEKNPLIINEWYRKKLNIINTQSIADLEITVKNNFLANLKTFVHNPQIIVRTAAWLSVISIMLGLIGATLGIIGMIN